MHISHLVVSESSALVYLSAINESVESLIVYSYNYFSYHLKLLILR